jgi:hypothetical protein
MDVLMAKEDTKIIDEAQRRFDRCVEAETTNRKNWLDDVKFYSGDQWYDPIKRSRDADNRPCLVVNRLPQFVRQVTNDQRQNRPSIKVRAVDDNADVETAEILQGLIRHIESNSNADQAYDNAFFYAVVGGYGYFRIVTDYQDSKSFEQEIFIKRIPNANSVYIDPESSEPDASDMNYAFIVDEMSLDEYERQYGDAEVKSWRQGLGDTKGWVTEETVRVAEYFTLEEQKATIYRRMDGSVGDQPSTDQMFPDIDSREVMKKVVKWYKICGDVIKDQRDLPGTYIPIIPVFGDEILVDGKRHLVSLIRHAKDPQRMLNYWRSTETELVALQPKAPFVIAEGQLEGYEKDWAAANSKNFAYLTYKPTTVDGQPVPPPARQGFASPPSGVLQGAVNAENDLKSVTGIYDASLGAKSNETSGRAILARQKEGDVSTFHFIDNLTRAIRQAGRVLLEYIPTVYDTPRVIRILGEDGSEEMKQINQPVPERDDEGQEIQRIYDFSLGSYDIVCTAGASYSTKRQETAEALQQLAQAYPPLMQAAGDLVIKSMDWSGADDIAERLKRMIPPELLGNEDGAPQIPQQLQQQMQQMDEAITAREQAIQQLQGQLQQAAQQMQQAETDKDLEQQKLQIEKFQAETDRMEAETRLLVEQQKLLAQQMQGAGAEVPQMDMTPLTTQIQAIQQALITMSSSMGNSKPVVVNMGGAKTKRARAMKMPDGSWAMESHEDEDQGEMNEPI